MAEGIDSIAAVGAVGAIDQGLEPVGQIAAVAPASARAQAPSAQSAPQSSSASSLQAALQQINTHLASYGRVMELRVDAASGVTVAQIVNSETGAVLQQIPSSDILQLADMLKGWAHGKDNALVDLMA